MNDKAIEREKYRGLADNKQVEIGYVWCGAGRKQTGRDRVYLVWGWQKI